MPGAGVRQGVRGLPPHPLFGVFACSPVWLHARKKQKAKQANGVLSSQSLVSFSPPDLMACHRPAHPPTIFICIRNSAQTPLSTHY